MENLIITVAITILILIAYLIFINQRLLRKVVTYKRDDEKLKINDERYYELNNKIQLIIVISSIMILIGGFMGYNSIKTIKSEINEEIGNYRETILSYDSIIKDYNKMIPDLKNQRDTVFKSLLLIKEEAETTKNSLIQLQNEYKLNAKTYFIKGIKITQSVFISDSDKVIRVYFKSLQKINSKIPQIFKEEPFLSVMSLGEGDVVIKNITKEYFEYNFGGSIDLNEALLVAKGQKTRTINKRDATKFDLIIIEGINQ